MVEHDIIGTKRFDSAPFYSTLKVKHHKNLTGHALRDCENELAVKVPEHVHDDRRTLAPVDVPNDHDIWDKHVCPVKVHEPHPDLEICPTCGPDSKGERCIFPNLCLLIYCNDDHREGIVR